MQDMQAKLPSLDPSSGLLCALASTVYIRDEILAMPETSPEKIEAAFKEFITSLGDAKLGGFASNASAAAKFAELDKAKKANVSLEDI